MSFPPNVPITAVVLADSLNENLRRCLKSVRWCQAIIIVDHQACRISPAVKKLHPHVKVVTVQDLEDFAAARNAGALASDTELVLQIDSDEWVTWSAQEIHELVSIIQPSSVAAVAFLRLDTFMGKTLRFGEVRHQWHARLYKKSLATFSRPIHEALVTTAEVTRSILSIHHQPHADIADFMLSVERYSERESQLRLEQHQVLNARDIILFPVGKALLNFIWKQGWRDGWPGIAYIVLMSWHSWLVRGFWYEKST